MKRFLITGALLALAVPGLAVAQDTTPTPREAAMAACKAERAQVGKATFKQTYGANGIGRCVNRRTASEADNQDSAAQACRAEREDPNFAANHGGKTFEQHYGTNRNLKNAFGKCVSGKAKAASREDTSDRVNAAKSCKSDRSADATAFGQAWGTRKNAFGKCVSATAKRLAAERKAAQEQQTATP